MVYERLGFHCSSCLGFQCTNAPQAQENASLVLNIRTIIILGPAKKRAEFDQVIGSIIPYLTILFRSWDDAVAQMTEPSRS